MKQKAIDNAISTVIRNQISSIKNDTTFQNNNSNNHSLNGNSFLGDFFKKEKIESQAVGEKQP